MGSSGARLRLPVSDMTALLAQEFTNRTPETSGGFWRLTYTDKDFRILYTNLGNVFVLVR